MNNQTEYRELGPDDVTTRGDESRWLTVSNSNWRILTPSEWGERVGDYKNHIFRRPITHAQGGERLTIEDARERRVCRICQINEYPTGLDNPFVLNYGDEYAHQKCIEAHPELPPLHRPTPAVMPCIEPSGANPATEVISDTSNPAQTLERMVESLESELQSLRAENERLKHKKAVSESVARAVSIRLTSLQSKLAAERKKREEAEGAKNTLEREIVELLDVLGKDAIRVREGGAGEDICKSLAVTGISLQSRAEQAERERDEARDKAAAMESSNDEWASDCRAISEACGLPFLDANGDHSDGNAQEVIDYLDTLKARVAELESALEPFATFVKHIGPLDILDARLHQFLPACHQARQVLGEKEAHIAPPAESAHTSIKEKTE